MPKPKKPEQEVAAHSPTTPPVTPRVQAQAVGESHDVILQMLQLFRDECEQKRQEDIRRREAEEERFNRFVATLGGQTMQQGDVSSPVGDPVPVSPSTPVVSTPSVLQPTTCAVSMYKKRKKQAGKQSVRKGSVDCNSGSTQPRVTCDRCGGGPHPKDRCPAVRERCRSCGKVGHYAKRCRSKTVKGAKDPPGVRDRRGNVLCVVSNPRDTGSPSCSAIYTAHTRAVDATATSLVGPTSPSIKLQVQAGDKSGWVECMPDTGADTTVMGSELLDTLGLTSADLRPSPKLGLSNPDGSPMACPILGSLYATMTYGDVSIQGWIIVVCGLSRQLLSYHHTKQLRIVPQDYPRQIKRQHLDGSVRQIAAPYHPTRKPRLPPAIASPNEAQDVALSEKACIHVRNVVSHRAASLDTATSSGGDMVIDGMRVAAQEDIVYTQLLEYVTKGFPTTCDRLDPAFKPFWKEHGRCDLPDTTRTQECQAPDPPKPRRRCRGGPLRRSLRVAERS
ncbi:hypothetical protein Pcinc_000826 [Petrolisthes cinctipes]|uniref:CCHC-type domain-containing protein n=1 Tax=Petrolisthes cinctipes TaxID=88211 RepID=A0AAE1GM35_PETCI|nr:hypothetical protein Pcinc_000826 [Petrolisthes cinctipes]